MKMFGLRVPLNLSPPLSPTTLKIKSVISALKRVALL